MTGLSDLRLATAVVITATERRIGVAARTAAALGQGNRDGPHRNGVHGADEP